MTDEEEAREAVLAWITKAESLLESRVVIELSNLWGRVSDWKAADELPKRMMRLAARWDEEFSKTCLLLGISEVDARRVSGRLYYLGDALDHWPPIDGDGSRIDLEPMRNGCLVDLAELSKLVAVAEDESPRNIRPLPTGRRSAKWISIEVFDKREEADKTLSKIGAEAREVRVAVSKRIYKDGLDPEVPSSRTVEDHIREKYRAHREKHPAPKP